MSFGNSRTQPSSPADDESGTPPLFDQELKLAMERLEALRQHLERAEKTLGMKD